MIRKLIFTLCLMVALPCLGDELADMRAMAEQGYAGAQYNLGVMYAKGEGVPQDYKEAVKWYRLAAEQGYAWAQYNLALMYAKGEGVPQDDKEALKWYRRAAEQGHAYSQLNLGASFRTGEGVPQDYVNAHMWYNLSASRGDEKAKHDRDLLADMMTPAQIAEAQTMAREWMAAHPDL